MSDETNQTNEVVAVVQPRRRASDIPGAEPGCPRHPDVEKRFQAGAERMSLIESSLSEFGTKLDAHIELSSATNSSVAEVLDILHAGKGFFRIVGYIATGIKWTAAFAAPVIALIYTIKSGGKP